MIGNCINLAQSSLLTNRTQLWHYFQLNQIVNADHVRFDCFGFLFLNLHRVHLKPSLFLNFYFESKDVFGMQLKL
jgi:hypothetical protein